MDTKGRIGLAIAVIATVLSLVMILSALAEPSQQSSITQCGQIEGNPNPQVEVRDRTFTTPSNCLAHGNLFTNSFMNALCDAAHQTAVNKANNQCVDKGKPLPCRLVPAVAAFDFEETRTCEEDPGHFSKLTCKVEQKVICTHMKFCQNDCLNILKRCQDGCGTDNPLCKQKCVEENQKCQMIC